MAYIGSNIAVACHERNDRKIMRTNVRKIAFAGVVAALYATLTVSGAAIAYGPVQLRFAEVLCILPFFFPFSTVGLFIGCLIANILSPYGLLDIAAGSFATLISAYCTMSIGTINKESTPLKALACFPPVIFNALIIGAVIAWSMTSGTDAFWAAFAINGMQVGFGQLIVLYALGLPLMIYLPKIRLFTMLNEQYYYSIR